MAFGLVLACGVAHAQGMAGMPGMADMQPVTPPEQLPAPVKMTGIGNSHITIKASAEAQAWFDQGLGLINDFWDYEGAKAFEQAIRVDPKCAMCWWGLAEAEGIRGDEGAAVYGKKALAEAMKLKDHASATDKLYIEAADAESRAKGEDNGEEIAILRKLVKKAPGDIEARISLAGAVGNGFDEKGEPKDGQKERIAILEGVLKEAPNDSAANHYWIHAQEPGNHPELALRSAALLASLAPNSGHMVHMPGHIFYRTGNYAEAEKWFAASTAVDEKYLAESHVSPDDDWNYVHNMMYSIANLMEQGKLKEANALSDHLSAARGKLSPTLYIWSARDQMARIAERLPVALRVGDWDAVLAMLGQAAITRTTGVDGEKTTNLRWLAGELGEYARGMKALEAGDTGAAKEASDRLDAGLWRADHENAQKKDEKAKDDKPTADGVKAGDAKKKDEPPSMPVMPDAVSGPLVKCLSVASLELRAGLLVAEGKLDEGKKMYTQAATEEKKLGYHEPPFYIRPVGENEAAVLMRAKDYAGAKAAYEAALKERPNSGFELYGLARVAELKGNDAAAREEYEAFLKEWATADETLPEVVHAKAVTRGGTVEGQ